jgi:hypothetical protein
MDSSPSFDPANASYSVVLPYGTNISALPTINYSIASHGTAVLTNPASLPGASTIMVTSQDGSTTNTYTINFNLAAPSIDATLTALLVTGYSLTPAFDPANLTYSTVLPAGTTIGSLPAINYTPAANAIGEKTDATVLPGASTILVTAQDGTTTKTYIVNFSLAAEKGPQTISMTLPDIAYGNPDTTIGATATSGLPVAYTSSNLKVATIIGGKLHVLTPGTSIITASQAGNVLYFPAPDLQQTLTVNKAKLTVTAHDTSRLRGTANPVFRFDYSGFKGMDNIDSINIKPAINCSAERYSPTGSYTIQLTGGSDNNYDLNLVEGTLTVKTSLGLDDIEEGMVQIYPNPVRNYLNISATDKSITYARLYSITGELIWEMNISKDFSGVDMSKFVPGIYILKITTPDNMIVKTIIKI